MEKDRPIGANALKAKYAWWANGGPDVKEFKDVFDFMIDNAPTIEAEPTKHGRWIMDDEDFLVCSECSNTAEYLPLVGQIEMPYCSNCGAKMDLDEVEE